jgi:hypothetical protein
MEVPMNNRLALLLASVVLAACGQVTDDASEASPPASGSMPPSGSSSAGPILDIDSPCDFSQSSSRVVLAATTGPYGGKQELYFVRANGETILARTFGGERAETRSYIYIGNVEINRRGDYLLATRGADGASVFDLAGNRLLDAATIAAATTFLESRGVAIEEETPRITVETTGDGVPVAVIRRPQEPLRVSVPDYRGEPYVRVESVRGDWALLSSYDADRTWRVNLATGDIAAMSKATPPGFQQFGAYQVAGPRLYFTLDDDGGFLATLRDPYAGGVYHSPDGVTGWSRIGSAARDVKNVAAGAQAKGTYVIAAYTTGPDTAPWSVAPADYGPVVSGAFDELVRPSSGKSYHVPRGAVSVSSDGRCAAYVGASSDGVEKVSILDVESGAVAFPRLPIGDAARDAAVTLSWLL